MSFPARPRSNAPSLLSAAADARENPLLFVEALFRRADKGQNAEVRERAMASPRSERSERIGGGVGKLMADVWA